MVAFLPSQARRTEQMALAALHQPLKRILSEAAAAREGGSEGGREGGRRKYVSIPHGFPSVSLPPFLPPSLPPSLTIQSDHPGFPLLLPRLTAAAPP